jgi:hypothetical protein
MLLDKKPVINHIWTCDAMTLTCVRPNCDIGATNLACPRRASARARQGWRVVKQRLVSRWRAPFLEASARKRRGGRMDLGTGVVERRHSPRHRWTPSLRPEPTAGSVRTRRSNTQPHREAAARTGLCSPRQVNSGNGRSEGL